MLENTPKSIEPFTSSRVRNSRFCIGCGEPGIKIVKYSTEGAVIVEKHCDKCAQVIEQDSCQSNAN